MAGTPGVSWGGTTTHTYSAPTPASGATPAPAFSFGSTSANTPAPTATFGSAAPAAGAPAAGTGLFGSTTTPAPASIFGTPSTGSLFGSPAPAPSTFFGQPPAPTSLFGAPAPAAGGGLFGTFGASTTAPGAFGQPPPQQPQQAQLPAQAAMQAHMDASARQEQARIGSAMLKILQQYNGTQPATEDKSSHFVQLVYNQATPEYQQMQYVHGMWANNNNNNMHPSFASQQPTRRPVKMPKPPQVSDLEWEQATVRNPDYNHFMPGALVGAEALQARLVSQQERAKSVSEQLQTLQDCREAIQQRHEKVKTKMNQVQQRHVRQRQELLALMQKVEYFRCMNNPLQPDEQKAFQKVSDLYSQLDHLTQTMHDLEELATARINKVKEQPLLLQQQEEDIPDEDKLKEVLSDHREELSKLVSTVQHDVRDLDLIQQRLEVIAAPRVAMLSSSSSSRV